MSEDYGSDFITLTDDDGVEYELEHLDTLEFEGNVYMAFTPADTPDEAEEVDIVILKAQDEDGEEILVTVEDEDELERVYNAFIERMEEEDE